MRLTSRAAAVVIAAAILVGTSGCAAITLPDAPPGDDADLAAVYPVRGPCAVTYQEDLGGPASLVEPPRRWGRPAMGRADAVELVRATGLFSDGVAAIETDLPAGVEWIVEERNVPSIEPVRGACPDGQDIRLLLTLGLIPVVRTMDGSHRFSVRRADIASAPWRTLSVGGPVTGVDGWLALPLHLMPWWFASSGSWWRTRREAELLAVELVKSGVLDEPPPAR